MTTRTRRSRVRWIAIVIWLVVFLLVATATGARIAGYRSQPADQHLPAAGGTVTITGPGDYSVYAETDLRAPGRFPDTVSVVAPSGATVPLSPSGVSETYTVGERTGYRLGRFTAAGPGTYVVRADDTGSGPGDELVVGTRTVGAVLGIVLGLVATGVVLLGGLAGGLALFLVGRRPPRPG